MLDMEHVSHIQFRHEIETSLVVAHELAHCGMAQHRDKWEGGRQPKPFDEMEEQRAIYVSKQLLGIANLEGNEQWQVKKQ